MTLKEQLAAGYKAWNDCRATDLEPWIAILADDFQMRMAGADEERLPFARNWINRETLRDTISLLTTGWRMNHFTPHQIIVDGNKASMVGRTSWTCNASGKEVEIWISHFWRFNDDGKAVELIEIFDTAALACATELDVQVASA